MARTKGTKSHKYTEEEFDFLRENYPKYSGKELTKMFNEKFDHDFSLKRLVGIMNKYKISSGRTGRFEKGQTPVNKGKKMSSEQYDKIKHTMFKPGHDLNEKPIGTEIIKDGYVYVKLSHRNWVRKQRLIYEQTYGIIPQGHRVIFADGDKTNFNTDNLILVSREELTSLNSRRLIFKGFPEGTKTGIILNKLIERSAKLAKKHSS